MPRSESVRPYSGSERPLAGLHDRPAPGGPRLIGGFVDLLVVKCHRWWPTSGIGSSAGGFDREPLTTGMFAGRLVPELIVERADIPVNGGADALGLGVQDSAKSRSGDTYLAGEITWRVAECDEGLKPSAGAAGVASLAT